MHLAYLSSYDEDDTDIMIVILVNRLIFFSLRNSKTYYD